MDNALNDYLDEMRRLREQDHSREREAEIARTKAQMDALIAAVLPLSSDPPLPLHAEITMVHGIAWPPPNIKWNYAVREDDAA